MNIKLTEAAVKQVKQIIAEQAYPADVHLRMGVVGGGCSGFQYDLGIIEASEVTASDEVQEVNGINVAIDKKSLLFIDGTTLDYSSDLMSEGFKFDNPNSKSSCGCNKSFSV
jgi:iron-sulfur cluster assembly protein